MDLLKELMPQLALEYYRAKFPHIPEADLIKEHLSAKGRNKYKDDTSGELAKTTLDFFKFVGGYAVRINTQGQSRGTGKRTFSHTEKGTADIHACYTGQFLSLEIKIGKDTQSDDQKKVQAKVEASGGLYFIIKSFDDVYSIYITLKNKIAA
jgi:hypothetical protein